MSKKPAPALAPVDEWIDLARPDHVINPLNRFRGILDYCGTLATRYEEDSRLLWHAQDTENLCMSVAREGKDPFMYEGRADDLKHIQTWQTSCDQQYSRLRALCAAALPLMPKVAERLKVLAFGPRRFDRDRKTDWQAFAADLAAIAAEARVMLATLENPAQIQPAEREMSPAMFADAAKISLPKLSKQREKIGPLTVGNAEQIRADNDKRKKPKGAADDAKQIIEGLHVAAEQRRQQGQ